MAGAGVAAAGLVLQRRLGRAVVVPFTIEDWSDDGTGGLVLDVPAARHRRDSPTVAVFATGAGGSGLEEVEVAVSHLPDGTVRLGIGDNDLIRAHMARGEVRIP